MLQRSSDKIGQLEQKLGAFREKCRQAGLKITPQRVEVYKTLIQTTEHPSAEMVFRKIRKVLPNISLDTVNRTLLTLSEIGAAFIVEGTGDSKRFDANLQTHQHFKCQKCRKIFDFYHEPFDKIEVPAGIKRKFNVLRKTVYLEGICDKCKKKNK